MVFSLCFQTTRVEFNLPEYSVRRRYQDFDWLRNKLEETQSTHLIPVSSHYPFWGQIVETAVCSRSRTYHLHLADTETRTYILHGNSTTVVDIKP